MHHNNVTALQGYWRVPWAQSGLVFQECPEPESCFGVVLDASGQAVIDELIRDAIAASNASANSTAARVLQSSSGTAVLSDAEKEADRQARLARMSLSADAFIPVAVPDLVLNAPDIEGCEVGHGGLLCTKCAQDYTRSGNF